MLISLILTAQCPCGATMRGVSVRNIRINKASMRTVKGDRGLAMMPRRCQACEQTTDDELAVNCTIADDDLDRVNAWRDRKGWEPFTQTQEVKTS